jgi:endonuclease YncB( thermonuclease family)
MRRALRRGHGLPFLAVLAWLSGGSLAQETCPRAGDVSARVISVNERLDLTLDDGRQLKIAGADPPRPTPDDPALDIRARDQLAGWLGGRTIAFRVARAGQDRWGRLAAFVYGPDPQNGDGQGAPELSVAEALIDAGLARYDPGLAAQGCRGLFLAAEAEARAAKLGLWADPYYAVLDPGAPGSFAERAGSMVILAGKVTSAAGRRPRVIFYVGPSLGPRSGIAVTMLARTGEQFEAAYAAAQRLAGKTVRVRGLLDTRFGPRLEIRSLDAVELLGAEQGSASSRSEP